jgi:DNA repair exonuclease SbcCD nuclease subunit
MDFIREIIEIAPVYFVSGNHEHQSGEWDVLAEKLVTAGVIVLDNGKSIVERNGDTITLIGLADKSVNRYYDKMLHTFMAGQEESFNILLSHTPELFETYVKENIDLAFTLLDPRQEKDYALGMNYFLEHTCTKHVFPMHFWNDFNVTEQYLREYSIPSETTFYVLHQDGQTFEIML